MLKQIATLRTVANQYKATGKLSEKELGGIAATLTVLVNDLKAPVKATAKTASK